MNNIKNIVLDISNIPNNVAELAKKEITQFGIFDGIGCYTNALSKVCDELDLVFITKGFIEWNLPSIAINFVLNYHDFEIPKDKFDCVDVLTENNFSINSKDPIIYKDYLHKIKYYGIYQDVLRMFTVNNCYSDVYSQNIKIPKKLTFLTFSFPCTDLSSQGKREGLEGSQTKSYVRVLELLENMRKSDLPKFIITENVKQIVQSVNLKEFEKKILKRIEKLGYKTQYKILKSSDYGSCQDRERFFLIGELNSTKNINYFDLMEKQEHLTMRKAKLDYIWNESKSNEFSLKLDWPGFRHPKQTNKNYAALINHSTYKASNLVYSIDGTAPTLTCVGANSDFHCADVKKKKIMWLSLIGKYQLMGFDRGEAEMVNDIFWISKCNKTIAIGNGIEIKLLKELYRTILKNNGY